MTATPRPCWVLRFILPCVRPDSVSPKHTAEIVHIENKEPALDVVYVSVIRLTLFGGLLYGNLALTKDTKIRC
jgi:hypothetical protein